MVTDAGFIFSLCAGVLIGLKFHYTRLASRKKRLEKKEDKELEHFTVKELDDGMIIVSYPYIQHPMSERQAQKAKEKAEDIFNYKKLLKDLWYGTGG